MAKGIEDALAAGVPLIPWSDAASWLVRPKSASNAATSKSKGRFLYRRVKQSMMPRYSCWYTDVQVEVNEMTRTWSHSSSK